MNKAPVRETKSDRGLIGSSARSKVEHNNRTSRQVTLRIETSRANHGNVASSPSPPALLVPPPIVSASAVEQPYDVDLSDFLPVSLFLISLIN